MDDKADKADGIDWVAENVPLSNRFGDTYYSKADGRAETGHVFIDGNRLPERWSSGGDFTIGELGFGTGLNFLETLRRWRQADNQGRCLKFISFERFPMPWPDMQKALSQWPELDGLTCLLATAWHPQEDPIITAKDSDVELVVHAGDANLVLPRLDFLVDAWFLDGFSPAKNPEMWTPQLMQSVFDHTRPGGSFATYSAAGWVRQNLSEAGFSVRKVSGYAGKRDMTVGEKPVIPALD